jgi:bud site selection protein 20
MGRYSVLRYKTKRFTKDLDQILYDDMSSDKAIQSLEVQPLDEYKPGLGQFYCIPCAKYFETATAKATHLRGKVHKRRVKDIKAGPYTREEADAAAGADVLKYAKKKADTEIQKQVPVVEKLLTVKKGENKVTSPGVADITREETMEDVEDGTINSDNVSSVVQSTTTSAPAENSGELEIDI